MVELFFQGALAVVGATNNQERYGYSIFKTLLQRFPDELIIPINPNCTEVLGKICRASLDEVSETIDTLIMIVNPKIGKSILEKALKKGIRKIWFQPGSDNPELLEFCEKNNLMYSSGVCLLHI